MYVSTTLGLLQHFGSQIGNLEQMQIQIYSVCKCKGRGGAKKEERRKWPRLAGPRVTRQWAVLWKQTKTLHLVLNSKGNLNDFNLTAKFIWRHFLDNKWLDSLVF